MPKEIPTVKLNDVIVRKRVKIDYGKIWEEPADSAPCFSFHLRPRFIQIGIGVKLLCCVSGKPVPEVIIEHFLLIIFNLLFCHVSKYTHVFLYFLYLR